MRSSVSRNCMCVMPASLGCWLGDENLSILWLPDFVETTGRLISILWSSVASTHIVWRLHSKGLHSRRLQLTQILLFFVGCWRCSSMISRVNSSVAWWPRLFFLCLLIICRRHPPALALIFKISSGLFFLHVVACVVVEVCYCWPSLSPRLGLRLSNNISRTPHFNPFRV